MEYDSRIIKQYSGFIIKRDIKNGQSAGEPCVCGMQTLCSAYNKDLLYKQEVKCL